MQTQLTPKQTRLCIVIFVAGLFQVAASLYGALASPQRFTALVLLCLVIEAVVYSIGLVYIATHSHQPIKQ